MPTKRDRPVIKVDISAWDMDDYADWNEAVNENAVRKMNTILASGIITECPFIVNLTDADEYGKLGPQQWKAVAEAVGAAVRRSFR